MGSIHEPGMMCEKQLRTSHVQQQRIRPFLPISRGQIHTLMKGSVRGSKLNRFSSSPVSKLSSMYVSLSAMHTIAPRRAMALSYEERQ